MIVVFLRMDSQTQPEVPKPEPVLPHPVAKLMKNIIKLVRDIFLQEGEIQEEIYEEEFSLDALTNITCSRGLVCPVCHTDFINDCHLAPFHSYYLHGSW